MTDLESANNSILNKWKSSFKKDNFKLNFFVTIILLIVVLLLLSKFLEFNELRNGTTIDDPFLNLVSPVNLTWLTFGLIYVGLVLAVTSLLKYPEYLLIVLQSYTLMVIIRIIAMYSLPLNPPQDMIALNDPFVQFFGSGKILEKDLFFSGHTSTMFLLFLTSRRKKIKMIFFFFTIIVGLSVLLQHVHYSVDVIVAPFIAYGCYRIALIINEKFTHLINPGGSNEISA